ncbi:MAG: TlpA family protein disulfide reductase, partial [Deltaproteobacteria bacterium]|nr:TlpA family protein disulfide reductase [Deltaproteobacteria bacterium]
MVMWRSLAAALLSVMLIFCFSCASIEGAVGPENAAEQPQAAMPGLPPMPRAGESAPGFELLSVDGKSYSLKEKTDGKVVSLVFWSLFCAPCRRSMPILNDFYKELRDKDFEVVTVNMDGERFVDSIKSYVAEEGLEFAILMDEYDGNSFKVADPYGVQGTPSIFLIDKDGVVAFSMAGDLERDKLEDLIARELSERDHENAPE